MQSLTLSLVLLSALVLQVQCQCSLSRAMIEGTNRIFTNRDAGNNYFLKRTVNVRTNEVLHMVCRPNDIVRTTCQRNRTFSVPLPMRCNNPMAATVTAITDRSCPGTMYVVGYTLNNRRLELYRSCYDKTNVRAIFTHHTQYPKPFHPARPCADFSTDGVITAAQAATFLTRNIYNTFRRIFGNNQRYIPNERTTVINRGHLTAAGDFMFGDQMCATFKYINAVGQFKSINDGNWETIERFVRGQVRTGTVLVKTGTNGVLTLPDSSRQQRRVILGTGSQNPVPMWMYKITRTSANRPQHAFLVYNNIFATARPTPPRICTSITCPTGLTLVNTAAAGYAFCCNSTLFNP